MPDASSQIHAASPLIASDYCWNATVAGAARGARGDIGDARLSCATPRIDRDCCRCAVTRDAEEQFEFRKNHLICCDGNTHCSCWCESSQAKSGALHPRSDSFSPNCGTLGKKGRTNSTFELRSVSQQNALRRRMVASSPGSLTFKQLSHG